MDRALKAGGELGLANRNHAAVGAGDGDGLGDDVGVELAGLSAHSSATGREVRAGAAGGPQGEVVVPAALVGGVRVDVDDLQDGAAVGVSVSGRQQPGR